MQSMAERLGGDHQQLQQFVASSPWAVKPVRRTAPTDYRISDLPADTPLKTLVRLAKIRWRIEHDYRELTTGLGLSHFEGRAFTGWHRHVTLGTAAQLFITRPRLTAPKAAGAA